MPLHPSPSRFPATELRKGTRKAVFFAGWAGIGPSPETTNAKPSPQEPWDLEEFDGTAWVAKGTATSQGQVDAFFAAETITTAADEVE